MAIVPFPTGLLRFTEGFRLANPSRGGVTSMTGSQQHIVSAASYWVAQMSFNCEKEEDYSEADGFLAALDGPANQFYCGPQDWRGRPYNVNLFTGAKITPDKVAENIAADPAYEANPATTGAISFVLNSGVTMNATSMTIRRIKGGFLRRGQYFSIEGRLHIITAVTTLDPVDNRGNPAPGNIGISFRPWLRDNYSAGSVIEFANPVGLMQLTADSVAMVERTSSPLSELMLSIKEYF